MLTFRVPAAGPCGAEGRPWPRSADKQAPQRRRSKTAGAREASGTSWTLPRLTAPGGELGRSSVQTAVQGQKEAG